MPEEVKQLRIGATVEYQEAHGTVTEIADKVKVKFDNGVFAFFDKEEIMQFLSDSRLKSVRKSKKETEEKEERAKRKYDKMKAEGKLESPKDQAQKYMENECKSEDPLAQK